MMELKILLKAAKNIILTSRPSPSSLIKNIFIIHQEDGNKENWIGDIRSVKYLLEVLDI